MSFPESGERMTLVQTSRQPKNSQESHHAIHDTLHSDEICRGKFDSISRDGDRPWVLTPRGRCTRPLEESERMDLIISLRQRGSYLTSKEVMALIQLRRNTLCAWVRAGRIPAVRTGSGYRFDPRHLADWLSARSTAKPRKREAK